MPLLWLCMQEAEAAAIASAAALADIRAKATFILNHLQPPVSGVLWLHLPAAESTLQHAEL